MKKWSGRKVVAPLIGFGILLFISAAKNVIRDFQQQDVIPEHDVHVYGAQRRLLLTTKAVTPRETKTTTSLPVSVSCRDLHSQNASNICEFVSSTEDCKNQDGFINYIKALYCTFPPHLVPLGVVLLFVWWLFLFVALASTADMFFCPSLAVISKTLRLSHNVAGVTFLAFGNGAPDIFSAISAVGNMKNGDAGLAIGALIGAGIFVTTVVAGSIAITKPFSAMERPFLRDVIFYIAAVFWTFYIFYDQIVGLGEALGFIGFYFFYVASVIVGRLIYQHMQKKSQLEKLKREAPKVAIQVGDEDESQPGDDDNVFEDNDKADLAASKDNPSYEKSDDDPDLSMHHGRSEGLKYLEKEMSSRKQRSISGETDPDSEYELAVLKRPKKAYLKNKPVDEALAKASETAAASPVISRGQLQLPALQRLKSDSDAGMSRTSSTSSFGRSSLGSFNDLRELIARSVSIYDPDETPPFKMLLEAINPIDTEEWANNGIIWKAYEIFKAPIVFILTITIPVVDYEASNDKWNKILSTLLCMTTPLFVVMAVRVGTEKINGMFPVAALVFLIGVVLCMVVFFTSTFDSPPKYHWVFAYVGFVVSVVWIYSIANEIVNLLQMFGTVFNLSEAILGLTLMAWGNSVGDLIADIAMAKQGFPRMAISACYGGPLFNLLLGIGIPFAIGTIKTGSSFALNLEPIQIVLFAFLTTSLVSSILIIPLSKFHVGRPLGIYLLVLYLVFLITAVLTEVKVIHLPWPN